MKSSTTFLILLTGLIVSCTNPTTEEQTKTNTEAVSIASPTNKVKLSSEIEWEKLNPARGDDSPLAGTIWGDRKGEVATGFLAKFADGFSSPPHIHNVTYRAVVISGTIHNDDPKAENMWMKPGSFWTQPVGEAHITSAKGSNNIAYVEIDKGPYLVNPIEEAFDNGERPINIDVSNLVWLDVSETNLIDQSFNSNNSPKVSFLWENNGLKGNFIKLPAGFNGKVQSNGKVFHAVVISGNPIYFDSDKEESIPLDAGSYFTSEEKSTHSVSVNANTECVIYVRSDTDFNILK